jgi:hypothetical protein
MPSPTFLLSDIQDTAFIGVPDWLVDGEAVITREELQSGHCTSGHCTSGQLSLTGFLDLDRWVPWLPIRTVRVHATDTAPVKRTGAVPAGMDRDVPIKRTRSSAVPSRSGSGRDSESLSQRYSGCLHRVLLLVKAAAARASGIAARLRSSGKPSPCLWITPSASSLPM